ncbi:guanine nucleotide-binding protein-like 3 homolog [Lutzomyia longipalpis]|uniref:guanine nucleotide-binding protein-like 3 homolog n=1 Tax=Lutzomyia longipalpis TaxID=7200 RepID=UPI00248468BF|nr:guanine nucleotide-binding protein-like 3 homolog [Lutzomyia longipalpis]
MALKCLKKKQSKRQPAKIKYKIQKKVREHHRKLRKEAKKAVKSGKKKPGAKKKMIQVPNICPFKEDILKEAEAARQQAEEERKQRREMLKRKRVENQTLESLVASAQTRGAIHEALTLKQTPTEGKVYKEEKSKENSLKAYFKEFKKVIAAADVILEVVDARDPLGTRCEEVEKAVRAAGGTKKLVVVLNKADLVPRENLLKWLKYLRQFGPATAFKASTQDQAQKLGRRKFTERKNEKSLQGSVCVGAELLMSMLGNYCRNQGIKTSIRVGVVGIPNVGKSSVINSLKRSRACIVGSTPGITKQMQEVELDSKINLLDCPGIVFSKGNENDVAYVLKNAQKVSDVKDPVGVATAVLQRATKMFFCKLYDITMFDTPEEFFAKKAKRMGKIKKGGRLDILAAARSVLDDWNTGKIRYCTHPPESMDTDCHVGAQIVSTEAREFDMENFEQMETEVLASFGEVKKEEVMEITSSGPVTMQEVDDDDDDDGLKNLIAARTHIIEQDEEVEMKEVGPSETKRVRRTEPQAEEKPTGEAAIPGNQSLNKDMKNRLKKQKKRQAKSQKKVDNVADVLDSFTLDTKEEDDSDDDYSFDTDFKN